MQEMDRLRIEVQKLEAELAALRQQESDRLDRLRHDLRTPVTSIVGFSSLLQESAGDTLSPKQQRFVEYIQAGAARLLRLVEAIGEESHDEQATEQHANL